MADITTPDLGWALGTLLRSYLKHVGEVAPDLPGGPRGYQVLSIVSSEACHNQAAIAERLGLDRTIMTYLLDDLEAHSLVARRPDPADRRSRQVVLTEQGRQTLATVAERIRRVESHLLAGLSEAEAGRLCSLLDRAARASESHDASEPACELYNAESVTSRPSAADR